MKNTNLLTVVSAIALLGFGAPAFAAEEAAAPAETPAATAEKVDCSTLEVGSAERTECEAQSQAAEGDEAPKTEGQ